MNRVVALVLVAVLAITGCGRRRERQATELRYVLPSDTTGLSQGAALLTRIEPYREPGGALRIRGNVTFPDGVRIQVSVYRKGTQQMLGRIQVLTADHRFDSPPIFGDHGPLPRGDYRFEVLSLFNKAWQTEDVMRRTQDGLALRGPGMTRDPVGGASFYLVMERTL